MVLDLKSHIQNGMATGIVEAEYMLKSFNFLLPRLIWLLVLPSAQHTNIRGQWCISVPGEVQQNIVEHSGKDSELELESFRFFLIFSKFQFHHYLSKNKKFYMKHLIRWLQPLNRILCENDFKIKNIVQYKYYSPSIRFHV